MARRLELIRIYADLYGWGRFVKGRGPGGAGNRGRDSRPSTAAAAEAKRIAKMDANELRLAIMAEPPGSKLREALVDELRRKNDVANVVSPERALELRSRRLSAATPTEAAHIYGHTGKREVAAFRAGAAASKRGSWGGDLDNAEIGYGQSAAHPTAAMVDAYRDGWAWYAGFK